VDFAVHLADLVRASNITGRERTVANQLLADWAPLVDDARLDRLGSYIGLKRGSGSSRTLDSLPYPGPESSTERPSIRPPGPPKILIATHIDSIGGMVTAIEPGGFLRFTPVGGVDRRLLMAQEVEVHGMRVVPGLIGSKPPHMTTPEERTKLTPVEQLYIDTGLPEQAVRELISLGAPVLPRFDFRHLENSRYSSRYMDNRASVVALRVALEELKGLHHMADLFAVGTVGEEFAGMAGAVTTTYAIKPDIAVAVDVTFARHPGSEEDSFPLGGGPTIGLGPNCTPKLAKILRAICKDLNLDYHLEVMSGSSGTDAWGMQVVRGGVATGVISIPLRYMHTPVETVALSDILATGRLIAHLVARVDEAFVEDLTCY
jgi:putative aminopeptidase FrvX